MDVIKIQKQKIIPPEKDIGTMFFDRVKRYGDRPVLTYKHEGRWKDLTWNETAELVRDVALGLMELKFGLGDMACILSETRAEWAYSYLGLASVGGICAGIYATNSPGQVQYILNDSRATLLFAEDQEQVDKILQIWDDLPHLRRVVVFERFSPKNDPRFMSLEELTGLGKKKRKDSGLQDLEERMHCIKQDDVVNIIYTSGTTGEPKGVMLAHFSFLYACVVWNDRMPISENDMGLSYGAFTTVVTYALPRISQGFLWIYLILSPHIFSPRPDFMKNIITKSWAS